MSRYDYCNHSSWPITFGVHPGMLRKIGRPVVVVSQTFLFCQEHYPAYEKIVLDAIEQVFNGKDEKISESSVLDEKLGCWITLSGKNFQLAYENFEKIYQIFHSRLL